MQRPPLHGRLFQAQFAEQRLVAGTGAEHHALCTDLPAVDAQAGQFPAFAQRFDALAGEQAVAGQFRQAANQVGDVEDDFREAVGLALEPLVAQRRRQISPLACSTWLRTALLAKKLVRLPARPPGDHR